VSTAEGRPRRFILIGGPATAIILLITVIAGGTLGYTLIEGWTVWDAFYMTVITVTTVGYKEVHGLSRAGQLFTVVLLLGGVGTALYTFTFLATAIVEGGLPKRLQRRRLAHMLDSIRDHFVVCGYGRIGAIVADQFRRQGVRFVIVERDTARARVALNLGLLVVEADGTHEDVLKQAGVDRARGLIAAVGTDAENVYTVLGARVLNPELFIVARAESQDSVQKMMRAGADRVISPYQIGAMQMAQTAIRPAVVDFVELATSSENLDLSMEEIVIDGRSPLAGRSVLEGNIRQRFGVIVVGIQRHDKRMEFNPEPDTVINGGDKLVVLGRPESLRGLEKESSAQ
jgi:voltage-gated potassium channel